MHVKFWLEVPQENRRTRRHRKRCECNV